MTVEFTAHNIRLDDGTLTKPDAGRSMETHAWFVSARRILETVFPGDKSHLRLADLGCLEGGFAVEFARIGFQVVGVEVRDANIAACNYVKSRVDLPNLTFVQDDAWNIAEHGTFDAVFCSGLLYHLDKPKQFLRLLSSVTTKVLILQTHFATDYMSSTDGIGARVRSLPLVRRVFSKMSNGRPVDKYNLSRISENEGLMGRWYTEFADDKSFRNREDLKWASWDNRRSFWIQREYLLKAVQDAGFDLVLEQFDSLGTDIAQDMLHGFYRTERRGTFIGIKTQDALVP